MVMINITQYNLKKINLQHTPLTRGGGSSGASVDAWEVKVRGGLGTGLVVDNFVLRYSKPARLVVRPLSSSSFLALDLLHR